MSYVRRQPLSGHFGRVYLKQVLRECGTRWNEVERCTGGTNEAGTGLFHTVLHRSTVRCALFLTNLTNLGSDTPRLSSDNALVVF